MVAVNRNPSMMDGNGWFPCQTWLVNSRIAVTVEQLWHRVPGGTAVSTRRTLAALLECSSNDYVGIAARHSNRSPALELGIDVHYERLPRPALYEAWHRLQRPKSSLPKVDLIWAAAMVIPPETAPIVATVHDVDFLEAPERLSRRGRSFFPRAWEVTRDRASAVAVPSEVVRQACIRQGLDRDRVVVIPWGVMNRPATSDEVASVRSRFDLPERFVLWVGTIEPRKNLVRLVEAVRRLDVPLVVVGPDGWNLEGADLLGPLRDRVTRLSGLSGPDLRAVYAAASVFVLPSLAEGFGLPVLEAMVQGTPVVTSLGTATEEVAGGAAQLVDPTNMTQISEMIERVLDDPLLAADLKKLGLDRVIDATWDETAFGYLELFDRVLAS